ncbi:MAG: hypothetical protein NXI16_10410 [Alphaproteobacteria bacterium]|nr:hypothetical protein [Alphaproteobacteria bacterium]
MTSFAKHTHAAIHDRQEMVFTVVDVGSILHSRSTVQLERLVHFLSSKDFTRFGDFFNLTNRSYAVFVSNPKEAGDLENALRSFCKAVEAGGRLSLPIETYHLPRDRQAFIRFIEKVQNSPDYPTLKTVSTPDSRFREMGEWIRIADLIHQIDIDNFVQETPIWRINPPNPLGFEMIASELTIGIRQLARAIDKPHLFTDPHILKATAPVLDERLFSHICREPSHQKGTIHLNVSPVNLLGQVFRNFLDRLPQYLRPTYSFELDYEFLVEEPAQFAYLTAMLRDLEFKVTLDKVPFSKADEVLVESRCVDGIKLLYDDAVDADVDASRERLSALAERHRHARLVLLYPETADQVAAGLRIGFEFVEGRGVDDLRMAIKDGASAYEDIFAYG